MPGRSFQRLLLHILLFIVPGVHIAGVIHAPAPIHADAPPFARRLDRPITALAPHPDGLLIGTPRGLWLWPPNQPAPLRIPLPDGVAAVTAIATTPSGIAWVADEHGLLVHTPDCWQDAACPFQRMEMPAGILPRAIATDGSIASPTGVFRPTATGWQRLDDTPYGITALAVFSNTRWALTPHEGLWQQTANGWRTIPLPGMPPPVAIAPASNALLLAADDGTIWALTSTDNRPRPLITEPTWPRPITALAAVEERLWVGTPYGLYTNAPLSTGVPSSERLPVLLIPGLAPARDLQQSQLKFLARALRADGYPVLYVDSTAPTRTLAQNAATVRHLVEQVQREGARAVWLIGHSYGGLVAEEVARQMGPNAIAGLITLGTPHRGMQMLQPLVEHALAESPDEEALRDLLPGSPRGTAPPNVPRLHIAGTALPTEATPLLAGFPANDGLIAATEALGDQARKRTLPALHGWNQRLVEWGIPTLTGPRNDAYLDIIAPWLRGETLPRAWSPSLPAFEAEAMPSWKMLATITVPAQSTITHPITDRLGTRTLLIHWHGKQPGTRLQTPDGEMFDDTRRFMPADMAYAPFDALGIRPFTAWAWKEKPGIWRLILDNPTATPITVYLWLSEPSS
nr:alpha/beta fold hydrolase [Ardenticatena sp.]